GSPRRDQGAVDVEEQNRGTHPRSLHALRARAPGGASRAERRPLRPARKRNSDDPNDSTLLPAKAGHDASPSPHRRRSKTRTIPDDPTLLLATAAAHDVSPSPHRRGSKTRTIREGRGLRLVVGLEQLVGSSSGPTTRSGPRRALVLAELRTRGASRRAAPRARKLRGLGGLEGAARGSRGVR